MAKIIPITEHFQHFLAEMKESFWGDLYGQTQLVLLRKTGRALVPTAARKTAAMPDNRDIQRKQYYRTTKAVPALSIDSCG